MMESRVVAQLNNCNRIPAARGSADAVRQMQKRLFGQKASHSCPISDAQMWRLLHALRRSATLTAFRVWLIGSRVQPGKAESDIDLLLSPRDGAPVNDGAIELALWHCRHYGLYRADPVALVDPCFRDGGPAQGCMVLQPNATLKTMKLFSPKLQLLVESGRIATYRRTGQFSIEYCRLAHEASYYRKLPYRDVDGVSYRFLRPAIELTSSPK